MGRPLLPLDPHAPDAPFLADSRAAGPGARRSLRRAARVLAALGGRPGQVPVLAVTASKGKGTAAIHAAATLAAAGLRVGLITSPHLRSAAERIRLDGRPIGASDYAELAGELAAVLPQLPGRDIDGGYLSYSGAHTVAGYTYLCRAGADVVVVEAGKGGASDELTVLTPLVAAVGVVFGEHLGELGDCVAAIAADKAGAAVPGTVEMVAMRQGAVTSAQLAAGAARVGAALTWTDPARDELSVELASVLPAGLSGPNAVHGIRAAQRMLHHLGAGVPDVAQLAAAVSCVRLPGRLTHLSADGRDWLIDGAIDRVGAAAAREHCEQALGVPQLALVGLPDSKDVAGTLAALAGLPVRAVATRPDLRWTFMTDLWPVPAAPLAQVPLPAGGPVLAVGMQAFLTEIFELLGQDVPDVHAAADALGVRPVN